MYPNAHLRAMLQFLGILSHKRAFGTIVWQLLKNRLDRCPTSAEWTSEVLSYKEGAQRIARASDGAGGNMITCAHDGDRLLAFMVVDAILNGQDAILLTSDRTLMEQFVTICVTLETHYRAWAACELMASELEYVPKPDPAARRCGFKCWPRLYRLPKQVIDNAMPSNPWPVNLHCWLIEPQIETWRFLPMSFRAERPMHAMLKVWGETDGAVTSKLSGLNAHLQWNLDDGKKQALLWVAEDCFTELASNDFPCSSDLCPGLSSIRAFDLIQAQNNGDPIAFPWHSG